MTGDASGRAEPTARPAWLLQLADQCVKCGYCLPVCPTFRLRRDESESPRGRVALAQGWLGGALPSSPRLHWHLNQCLGCLACERACPSLVRFGALLDGARAERVARLPRWRQWLGRQRPRLLGEPRWLAWLARAAWLYRRVGLAGWIERRLACDRYPRLANLSRLSQSLRHPLSQPRRFVPALANADAAPALGLFLGCVARATEQDTIAAARSVLDTLCIVYDEPLDQGCCGALLRHNGYPDSADQLLARNARAFGARTLVGCASACVAELRRHPDLRAVEICRFLVDSPALARARPRPLALRVAVHEPCSHRNQLRDAAAIHALLRQIPELIPVPLPDNAQCCGAAGTYLIDQAATANALAAAKVEAARHLAPDLVVTTNSGCALHLGARLRAAGLAIPVMHPVTLLAHSLGAEPPAALRAVLNGRARPALSAHPRLSSTTPDASDRLAAEPAPGSSSETIDDHDPTPSQLHRPNDFAV